MIKAIEPDDMNPPEEPTHEQCSAKAELQIDDGRKAYAAYYPQMGGYVGKCVIILDGNGGCFDAWVWHDGEFPFSTGQKPSYLHHCDPGQFIEFGELVGRLSEGWLK